VTSDPAREHRYLLGALLLTFVLSNIPYGYLALYPFKIFATWVHESCHALVMLMTGAGVDRLHIFPDTSGLAVPARGVTAGAQVAISCAGYMGTAAFGALFLILGRTAQGARWVLALLGALMAVSAALMVRNAFGLTVILGGAALLLATARLASETVTTFLLNFLAAQSCINAVLDIRILYSSEMVVDGQPRAQSDADAVAAIAGGPAWLWATLWLAWSFGLFFLALRFLRVSARVPAWTARSSRPPPT
jgi:hypothetical protein